MSYIDRFTLCDVFSKLETIFNSNYNDPPCSITAKVLGKRMNKISTQAQEKSGDLNRYLIDLFKNHKIIKIFQRENFENIESEKFVNDLKEKSAKIQLFILDQHQ